MARDLLADDPEFVAELESRLAGRRLVQSLAVVRARAGLSQGELAVELGCSPSRVSKIESGSDADVRVGDVAAILEATGHEAKIFVVPGGGTLADEIEMHASQIGKLLRQMIERAGTETAIPKGVAAFLDGAARNLAELTKVAGKVLSQVSPEPRPSVQIEIPELEGNWEWPAMRGGDRPETPITPTASEIGAVPR